MNTIKSVGATHGVIIPDTDSREEGTEKVLDHVTHGGCADGTDTSPGCERVVKDMAPRHQDVVHLQVAVLKSIIDVVSKKQLGKVLRLHEIDYDPTDTQKVLRSRLKNHIRWIENGKLKEVEQESDAIERLRKLDEIRKNWPKLIPSHTKEKIIRDFRAATSSAMLASFTCACCGRQSPVSDRVCKQHTDVNLDLLERPQSEQDPHMAPAPFTSGPLENKLLDPHGVRSEGGGKIMLDLCVSCSRGLHRKSLPKHALANRLYLGSIPDELSDLTMVEECMIARARAKSWIVKLQEQDSDSASSTAQRGLKGHTIIYPQQPDKLAEILPPPVGEALTFICVIFVGSTKLMNEWLQEKAKLLVVRWEKVRKALIWLKGNNPLSLGAKAPGNR